jgi:acyl carrier protein
MVEFLGRGDNQVKIRGQRVELGEVESVLGLLAEVRGCAVVTAADPAGLVLVAFVESAHAAGTLQAALAPLLPAVMRPARIEVLDRLPRMANGKIDRAALAGMAAATAVAASISVDSDPMVKAVAEVLAELLQIAPPPREADFFELGGHSLLAISAIAELEKRVGAALDLDEFMDAATVGEIAARLSAADEPVRPLSDPDALSRLLFDEGASA